MDNNAEQKGSTAVATLEVPTAAPSSTAETTTSAPKAPSVFRQLWQAAQQGLGRLNTSQPSYGGGAYPPLAEKTPEQGK